MAESTSLDPADWDAERAQAHAMLDDMLDHMAGLREQPVWRAPTEASRAAIREPMPRQGAPLAAIHQTFLDAILPHASGNAHPGFMGWVQGGGALAGMLAEMLAAGMNANVGGRDHMAIAVEQQVTAWTREMFGFPSTATGLFVTGSSQANFLAALVARTRFLGPDVRRDGLPAGAGLTAYASAAVHGCVGRAMDMMGLGRNALTLVPCDARQRMDMGALREAIARDRAAGRRPFLLVGTAGSVDTGAIDDLDALADVARDEGLHFHVDGAFGALGVLSPAVAPRLRGLERADSLAFDWHKWGQVPYDAGYLLVRDGQAHRTAFAAPANYLQRLPRGLAAGDFWPCDYGSDLSRGFRALKVWFTLKAYGAQGLGRVVERCCALARDLAGRIAAEPALVLAAPVELNVVCFRHLGEPSDELNREIVMRLHEAGRVAPSLTRLDGRAVIRAAIVNHRTDARDIAALVDGVLEIGRECSSRHAA